MKIRIQYPAMPEAKSKSALKVMSRAEPEAALKSEPEAEPEALLTTMSATLSETVSTTVSATLAANYGNQLRIRVCGLIWQDDRLLLVKHQGLGSLGYYWSPPGGGLDLGETLAAALMREVYEETNLVVNVGPLCFINQYINMPIHAVEHFFMCHAPTQAIANTKLGIDPEQKVGLQLLTDIAWMTYQEILDIPAAARHQSFSLAATADAYQGLSGLLPSLPI